MYAEKYAGLARGRNWAVTLTIGTGVGSGVMLDGKILADPHLQFGTQAGHMVIDLSHDQLCLTGARGTGEMLCSATALVLAVRSGLQRGIPSTLSDRYWADPHAVNFRSILEDGVATHDPLCMDELRRWTIRLSWMLVNVVSWLGARWPPPGTSSTICGRRSTPTSFAILPEKECPSLFRNWETASASSALL
jgi:glucokinase